MNADKPSEKPTDKVAVSVTIPKDLLHEADERATALDLTRSQYFRQLVRKDISQTQPEKVAA